MVFIELIRDKKPVLYFVGTTVKAVLNEVETNGYHMDAYRILSEQEIRDLGTVELIDEGMAALKRGYHNCFILYFKREESELTNVL